MENIVRTQLAFREGAGDSFALKLDLNFNFRTEVTALLPFVDNASAGNMIPMSVLWRRGIYESPRRWSLRGWTGSSLISTTRRRSARSGTPRPCPSPRSRASVSHQTKRINQLLSSPQLLRRVC